MRLTNISPIEKVKITLISCMYCLLSVLWPVHIQIHIYIEEYRIYKYSPISFNGKCTLGYCLSYIHVMYIVHDVHSFSHILYMSFSLFFYLQNILTLTYTATSLTSLLTVDFVKISKI